MIIESTGVANTLRVVEKLLVGDIFEQYDLKQSLYVVDGAETKAEGLAKASATPPGLTGPSPRWRAWRR